MKCRSWARGVLAFLLATPWVGLSQADGQSKDAVLAAEDTLKKQGLERAGGIFKVASEADALSKIDAAAQAYQLFKQAEFRKASTVSPEQYKAQLQLIQNQINMYRNQINAANQQLRQVPRGRRGFTNNLVAEERGEVMIYRNQLQAEMNQANQFLNQMKKNPPSPQEKARAESDARDARENFEKAVKDAREAVDSTIKKYEELAGNTQVRTALEELGHGPGVKPKLGPSRTLHNALKRLEKLEQLMGGGDQEKPAAKKKHTPRTRSLRSARGLSGGSANN